MAFYAYTRVSTESQAEKGGGLETQRQNIQAYADSHDITIDQWFTDAGISGALKDTDDDDAISKRPALIDLLATVDDGDTVIVLNTSRLWRSDTAKVIIRRQLKKAHAKVIAIENERFDLYASNPNDRLIDGIMELLDEWDRASIAIKLSKGRTAKAKTGSKPAGICPYGYQYADDKKSVIISEPDAKVVRHMFSLAQTGKSLSEIASAINAEGIKAVRGGDWTRGSIRVILRNRFYIGELSHQGKQIQGNHEPIISRVQFGKVAAQLDKRHK